MKAIIISVGNELTTGQTIDTNSAYLSRQLAVRGIAVLQHVTVPDDKQATTQAIRLAAEQADVVIVSGGLGPTEDDLSRAALADALNCPLVMDPKCLADMETFFKLRNWRMNDVNKVQAMIPAQAQAIPNKVGTAPGIAARLGNCRIFVVPGVPSEMEWMFGNAIAPALPSQAGIILHRIVHTIGAGESDVGAKIADLMQRGANPLVGTTVAAGMVSIRIVTHAPSQADANTQAEAIIQTLHDRLGDLIIGQDDQTLPVVLGQLLRENGQTLASAESCTGGLIGKMMTDIAGSSDYYLGGVISYSNRLKTNLLGVSEQMLSEHGAVSQAVALAMAKGCRQAAGSDWAIAVTGIAGPGGATQAKPVGLVYIGLVGPGVEETHRQIMPGSRDIVRLRSALAAMNYLRLHLLAK
jgi:nicotinamide-nucleotide amidase